MRACEDAKDTPEISDLDEIFCGVGALLQISRQPPVAVGQRAEGRLDPPPQRQRGEAMAGRVAEHDLDLDIVAHRCRAHRPPGTKILGQAPP